MKETSQMNISRSAFLKTVISAVPFMAFAQHSKAIDGIPVAEETTENNGLSPELVDLLEQQDQLEKYSKWYAPPEFNGKIKVLPLKDRYSEMKTGGSAKLVRIEEGVVVPPHMHPEGEFTYVTEGSFVIESYNGPGNNHPLESKVYQRGDYIWMPAGSIHGRSLSHGVTFVSMTPQPILYKW